MTRRAMIAALGALLLAPLATHARAEVSELRRGKLKARAPLK